MSEKQTRSKLNVLLSGGTYSPVASILCRQGRSLSSNEGNDLSNTQVRYERLKFFHRRKKIV